MVSVRVCDAQAGRQAGQYRGGEAEGDVRPPTGPARPAEDATEAGGRGRRAVSVSSGTGNGPRPGPGSRTPRGKHAGAVTRPRQQLEGSSLPDGRHAVARVPGPLVIDFRKATRAPHTRPDNGAYQDFPPGKPGDDVPLSGPFGLEVRAGDLPVYGEAPRPSGGFTGNSQ